MTATEGPYAYATVRDEVPMRDATPMDVAIERLRNVSERLSRGSSLLHDSLSRVRDPRESAIATGREIRKDEPVAPAVADLNQIAEDLEATAERIEYTRSQLHV